MSQILLPANAETFFVEQAKGMADDLAVKHNAAYGLGKQESREEIGDNLYRWLNAIEKVIGERYRPNEEVLNL